MKVELVNYDWEFIQNYYPKYDNCPLVLQSDIIARYFEGQELSEEDSKWLYSIGLGQDELIKIYANEIEGQLYDASLQAYKEKLIEQKNLIETLERPKTHRIYLTRIGYAYTHIDIQANTREEAQIIALEQAGDLEYSEKDAEYKVDDL